MDSYWSRFVCFVRNSLTEKFKVFFPGVCMAFLGAKHFLWIGIPITWVEGILKGIGTVVLAFFSGLSTAYAAYLMDRYKEKKSPGRTRNTAKRKRA